MISIQRCLMVLSFTVYINKCDSARILAVFPLPSASHAAVLHTISVELAKRGHELVVFDGYPLGNKIQGLKNYHEVHLENVDFVNNAFRFAMRNMSHLELLASVPELGERVVASALSNSELTKLISPDSGEKFDLVMIEWISWDALNALGYRFNAPVVGLITVPVTMMGFGLNVPFSSVDMPNYMFGRSGDKTFIQRVQGFALDFFMASFAHYSLYRQERLVKKHFGPDYPHVYDMMRNVSMVFSSQDPMMPYPMVSLPNVINMGGIHVQKSTDQKLPTELKDFMDGAESGVVYLSFGSTMPGTFMEDHMRKLFVETFAKIPQRVVWKWEDKELPGKPANVFISKWLPQRAILAHPNTKAFIYQGGLQSTEEAIAAGIPLIGLPLFGDQSFNVNKMVGTGGAIKLEFDNLTEVELKEAIREVIENGEYKRQMSEFRDILNDRPYDPLNNTMWWIEYVIRHKGAHHLRVGRGALSWYQAQQLDVICFCFAAVLITLIIAYKIIKFSICYCCLRRKGSGRKVKQS